MMEILHDRHSLDQHRGRAVVDGIFVLLAWWASSRNSRWTRALIAYLKENEKSYWCSLPLLSRNINPVGIIEANRRSGQSVDRDFFALYRARKSGALAQISAIILAVADEP